MTGVDEIRQALRELPSLAIASSGRPPEVEDVFFPLAHAQALDPDVSLVIGNRGMGKTFWTLALASPEVRPLLSSRYTYLRRAKLEDMDVDVGFADAEGASGAVSRALLESISDKYASDLIWRSVMIRLIAARTADTVPSKFSELVKWVQDNPEDQLEIFRKFDKELTFSNRTFLVVFDQLDQLASTWDRIQDLTQGLVKLALAMKSYRSIKIKIFMRTDQAENKELFRFPDGSKILGGSKVLRWRDVDLFGLLFFEILKSDVSRGVFEIFCQEMGVDVTRVSGRTALPISLSSDTEVQAEAFHRLAGPFMGRNAKRGRPYTWLPTHLADGRGEISPRTFLQVIKTAAQAEYFSPTETVIDFRGILEGVRKASSVRLAELEEDYPWVSNALEPLKGLLVPCEPKEIMDRWANSGTVEFITRSYQGAKAPLDLQVASLFGEQESEVLTSLLTEIGVFEERKNGKINIPDIFRVNAGILRKGGVPPQERRSF